MAGQAFSITRGPTTITETTLQPGREALDLSGLSGARLDFNLRTQFVSGSGVTLVVTVETSMTNDDNPNNWSTLATFATASASNTSDKQSVDTEILRYLRWTATVSGSPASFTFEVLGMAW